MKFLSFSSFAVRDALAACALGAATAASAATVRVDVTDDAGRPLSGAVAFLESPEARAALRPGATAEIAQASRQFVPATTVVSTGTLVRFPNHDRVRHHVYSFSPAKKFELKLYSGTDANPVQFDRSGIVVLGCNIHDDMVGWVVVVDTPYHAVAPKSPQVTIDNVPPGSYRLRVWHSSLPPGAPAVDQPLVVSGAGPAPVQVRLAGAKP